MDIHIRRAGINDAKLLSQLGTITFLDTFRGTCTDDDIEQFVIDFFNEEDFLKQLQDPLDFYFIAYEDDKAIGYLRLKEDDSDVPEVKKYKAIELKRLYVLKEYINKKVGAALMRFALNFALENQYEAMWLGVWEYNERAKAFYKKWGFQDTGCSHPFPIGSTPQTDLWYLKVIAQ